MSELALARVEALRYFRKPSNTRDIVLIMLILFAILSIVAGVAWWAIHVLLRENLSYLYDIRIALGALERTRYFLLALEAASLAVIADMLANKSVHDEVESESLSLLLQTPISLNRLLLGKLLGLAAVLLVYHSICLAVLMIPTPFMGRPAWAVLYELGVVWFFAVWVLPEGAAEGLAKQDKGRRLMLVRLAILAKWGTVFLLLHAAIPAAARHQGVNVWDVLVSYWKSHIWLAPNEHLGFETIRPMVLTTIVLGWQVVSGLIMWMLFIRGRTR